MKNQEILEKDLKYNWHPCTQMKDHEFLPLIPIKKGEGVYLEDFDGNRYIDAISSWWVNLFGHCNPYINKKITEQLNTLEHVIFAGFTHMPAVKLAERICNLTKMDKVFYADNGSSAVEVAIKMSFHYWKNKGEIRPLFFSLENSYHGETIGALSVGDVGLYKDTYKEILIKNITIPIPKDKSEEETNKALRKARKIFEKYHKQTSAFIIEPLIQCAGYMKMHSAKFVKGLKNLCEEFNIHFIADEIAVGFGRSGSMFACEQAKIKPDFMLLSKGLTGGYLPLSLCLTTDEIYQAFYCDYTELKAFLHSHSYTANPLGCAAANATLDIFEKENVIEKNKEKSKYIWESIQKFKELPNVKEIRQTGMITAIEMIDYPWQERKGLQVYEYGLQNGVLLRPLGNVIYFMPPYIINKEEIDRMINVAYEGIKRVK
ncbi:adenosylmethionine--8-amino-7-oxononanoate transaminase [Caminibacter mediatlanticus TB-2]|uniref:Adenosylmethionine-8-amino-7-oxononanoate aminotransferase n=1 Tax=Caminibacter mediatlanticus TB-2 TaxID=391592 RepID=A0AAI9F2H3_9BACT|nr:adenosylmethionine--8-amino-7-oxononanoate transaminase [Caminibacter mediatlanticus]EDM23809.1 Adenosylmethionine--8-amino-7-oxononanoate aminotransferase [Caminibacter mediatlanticus TB-2]QCT94695.1 adenosylmethionine--8-amino-7-oxononanoate transaminase [Caminibacter mediatlanticus TB-2]